MCPRSKSKESCYHHPFCSGLKRQGVEVPWNLETELCGRVLLWFEGLSQVRANPQEVSLTSPSFCPLISCTVHRCLKTSETRGKEGSDCAASPGHPPRAQRRAGAGGCRANQKRMAEGILVKCQALPRPPLHTTMWQPGLKRDFTTACLCTRYSSTWNALGS